MSRGEQLLLVTSSSQGAVEVVEVRIHGLGLPEVRPGHRRQNAVLTTTTKKITEGEENRRFSK